MKIYYIIDGMGKVHSFYFKGFLSRFFAKIEYKILCKRYPDKLFHLYKTDLEVLLSYDFIQDDV